MITSVPAATAAPLAGEAPKRGRAVRNHVAVLLTPALAALAAWALRAAGLSHGTDVAFAALLAGTFSLTLLRRNSLLFSTFLAGLFAHSVLWERAWRLSATIHYHYVAEIDRYLGFGTMPTVRLQEALHEAGVFRPHDWIAFGVYLSFFGLPLLLLVPFRGQHYELGRKYVASLLLASLASWPVFALAATAPPWLATVEGIDGADYVAPLKLMLQGTSVNAYLDAGANLVAAMPSLHQAVAVICALAMARAWPRVRWGALSYALAMGVSLVYLGEHYLIDVLAGAVLGLGAWIAVQHLDARAGRTRWRLASAVAASPSPRESDVR